MRKSSSTPSLVTDHLRSITKVARDVDAVVEGVDTASSMGSSRGSAASEGVNDTTPSDTGYEADEETSKQEGTRTPVKTTAHFINEETHFEMEDLESMGEVMGKALLEFCSVEKSFAQDTPAGSAVRKRTSRFVEDGYGSLVEVNGGAEDCVSDSEFVLECRSELSELLADSYISEQQPESGDDGSDSDPSGDNMDDAELFKDKAFRQFISTKTFKSKKMKVKKKK